jgi:ribonuclease P protein component
MANDLGWARLGLIVGRKVEPRAVRRNYLKRLVREAFRLHQGDIGSQDVVVQVRSTVPPGRIGRMLLDELHVLFMTVNAWSG